MLQRIRRAVRRAAAWQRTPLPRRQEPTPVPAPALRVTSPHRPRSLRALRDAVPLDHPGRLVRPYLLAHEQQERRAETEVAAAGNHLGPWFLHGHEAGLPVRGAAA
ncbi:hypothetical protein ABZ705_12620 [Streptomyces sp. NPDC006984]|uniref:hypothetical protein n=1 Tax=Streptomyces sp. NPDC006984 TaxID=3155463 RepID=UPI00340D3AF2